MVRDLRTLPKAHLHVHIDGAMRRSTFLELAGADAVLPGGYGSFAAFTETIEAAARCLRTAADAERLVDEIVEDAAAAGAVWIELSMWPGFFRGRLGSDGEVVDLVVAAGHHAARRHGCGFGLIVAANRVRGPAEAVELAELAASRSGDVVGFGLDGDEVAAPGRIFGSAFAVAKEAGLLAVPHAGELAGPESVRGALDLLGANRIMHGVRAIEDPELVRRLAASDTSLDVCPTSNMLLSVVPSIEQHPLPSLLDAGVRCSINADDPLLFDTDLLAEYERARSGCGLTDVQLAACAETSLRHSAAPVELVESACPRVAEWVA